jgi:thiamine biosynthesis lipoprotein
MGTVVSLDARGAEASRVEAAFGHAMAWLHEVDHRFSTYRVDSEISLIDHGELAPEAASDDVRWVLARCAAIRSDTGGAFDERAGGRLDPSAFVKGWAVERAAGVLASAGLSDFLLNVGGDVVVRGGALPDGTWRVGIQHPRDRAAVAMAIEASDVAIATSGAYERGSHIVDPRTGAAAPPTLSVTVVGPDLGVADAYSTAAFAMGLDGPAWTLGLGGYEAMTVLADDRVLCTPGFPAPEEAG